MQLGSFWHRALLGTASRGPAQIVTCLKLMSPVRSSKIGPLHQTIRRWQDTSKRALYYSKTCPSGPVDRRDGHATCRTSVRFSMSTKGRKHLAEQPRSVGSRLLHATCCVPCTQRKAPSSSCMSRWSFRSSSKLGRALAEGKCQPWFS